MAIFEPLSSIDVIEKLVTNISNKSTQITALLSVEFHINRSLWSENFNISSDVASARNVCAAETKTDINKFFNEIRDLQSEQSAYSLRTGSKKGRSKLNKNSSKMDLNNDNAHDATGVALYASHKLTRKMLEDFHQFQNIHFAHAQSHIEQDEMAFRTILEDISVLKNFFRQIENVSKLSSLQREVVGPKLGKELELLLELIMDIIFLKKNHDLYAIKDLPIFSNPLHENLSKLCDNIMKIKTYSI